jgi:hypothetical protein
MSTESVDFYINDTTLMENPVAGVTVKILSSDGTTFITQSTTDSSGHAGFLLPSGVTYQARFFLFQVGFTNPQLFTVYPTPLSPGQSNAFNIAAQLQTPPVPTDANLCTAYGTFRDITGAPQPNVEIHFIAKFDPVWLAGSSVLSERRIIRTDQNGYAQINLIRNGMFDVTIQGEEEITRQIDVPDAPNVNLADLIFPIVSLVEWGPGPYSVEVGQELSVTMSIYASDGEDLGLGIGDVFVNTSDDTVLNFAFSDTGLILMGTGVGTATITITRADLSIIHIPDSGIQNGSISVSVTL